MNKKFRTLLSERIKDAGLTDKAIDELTNIGANGLADDASEEDITKAVDLLVPFAKAMQAEITRKTRKTTTEPKPSATEGNKTDEGNANEMPEWFKAYQKSNDERLQKLIDENESLKSAKAKADRAASIAEKAKKLGIPDYLMKRVSFADDADLDKELGDYKQELVTNNLMPKAALEKGNTEDAMKASAEAWAQSLPDK